MVQRYNNLFGWGIFIYMFGSYVIKHKSTT